MPIEEVLKQYPGAPADPSQVRGRGFWLEAFGITLTSSVTGGLNLPADFHLYLLRGCS